MSPARLCVNCHEELAWDAIICPSCATPTNSDQKVAIRRAEQKRAWRLALALAIVIALVIYLIRSLLL